MKTIFALVALGLSVLAGPAAAVTVVAETVYAQNYLKPAVGSDIRRNAINAGSPSSGIGDVVVPDGETVEVRLDVAGSEDTDTITSRSAQSPDGTSSISYKGTLNSGDGNYTFDAQTTLDLKIINDGPAQYLTYDLELANMQIDIRRGYADPGNPFAFTDNESKAGVRFRYTVEGDGIETYKAGLDFWTYSVAGGTVQYDIENQQNLSGAASPIKAGDFTYGYSYQLSDLFKTINLGVFDEGEARNLSITMFLWVEQTADEYEIEARFGDPGAVNGRIGSLPTDDPAPVPLPAGLPLLLAGLGAFGVLRRRR